MHATEVHGGRAVTVIAALVCIVLGVLPIANLVNPGIMPWYGHIAMVWIVFGGMLFALLLLISRFAPAAAEGAANAIRRGVLAIPLPLFLGTLALFVLFVSAAVAIVCFGREPHNADEVAQLWHARILLSGRLALPVDPNPEFFAIDNVIDRGLWYSQFPIGGPAVLAIGMALGAAWLVNPVLLALSVFCLHDFARRTHGEATARAATLLLALSPMALFMGASFMNHVPILFLTTLALAAFVRCSQSDDSRMWRRTCVVIGLSLGICFTIRPLDAAIVALVIGAAQLLEMRRRRARWPSLVWQIAAGMLPVVLLMVVHSRTTGAPLRFGYEVLYGSAHQLGFHQDPYGAFHTPQRALSFAGSYLTELSVKLFEWPLPALAILAAGLLAWRRPSRWDLILLALCGSTVLAYALYWHQGNFRGPRFLFTALPAFYILIARTPAVLAARFHGTPRRAARLLLPACMVVAWGAWVLPDTAVGRAAMYSDTPLIAVPDPGSMEREVGLTNALVFVRQIWPQRLIRRVWALGMPRGWTARLMASAQPCAIENAVEREEDRASSDTSGRAARLLHDVMSSPPDAATIDRCAAEGGIDRNGGTTYGPFLAANQIDSAGHVGGNVIYVIDLGAHDEVLRKRFGSRRWYVLSRHLVDGDTRPMLQPYDSISVVSSPTAPLLLPRSGQAARAW